MRGKSLALHRILSDIAANGPLTFARFMGLALYDPAVGYYASGRAKIGRRGDFFTNVSVGPVFGNILAGQFREMWLRLRQPRRFAIVEQGANDGQLALDVLSSMEEDLLRSVEYWVVEPFSILRRQQEQTLQAFGTRIRWTEHLKDLPRFEGVHFSNELVDSLPFHLLRSTGEGWQELCVDARDEQLVLSPREASEFLSDQIKMLPRRAEGTIVELRPAAGEWIREVAEKLRVGFVLIIDYGFSRDQLLSSHRPEGTFACYQAHHRDFRVLDSPGQKDITAHVDFTALAQAAVDAGLRIEGYTDQHHFLVGAAQDLLRKIGCPVDTASQKTVRSIKTLLHPESMGRQFHYLVLAKDVDRSPELSGFQFARDPDRELFSGSWRPSAESHHLAW
jgi:SAM-dependent MidA family methyltransferase